MIQLNSNEKRLVEDLAVISAGLSCYVFGSFLDLLVALIVLVVGTGLAACGMIDIMLFINFASAEKKRLLYDKQGLAWIWIAGFVLTIPMCALVYWALDYPFDMIVQTVSGIYTFTGTMAYAWDTAQFVISYLLAFVVIYAVVWVITNSKTPNMWGN